MVAAIPLEEKTLLTEDEYAALGNAYEIIDGELIERESMSTVSAIVRDNVYDILKPVARHNDLGFVFNDGVTYLMSKTTRGLKGAYIPDVSFIRKAKISRELTTKINYPGVPDLAIEVVSPNDDAEKLQIKIRGYLERGTEQVWVIFPEAREVLVYRQDQPDIVRAYRGEAKIDASAFFPNLEIAMADIFWLPTSE